MLFSCVVITVQKTHVYFIGCQNRESCLLALYYHCVKEDLRRLMISCGRQCTNIWGKVVGVLKMKRQGDQSQNDMTNPAKY